MDELSEYVEQKEQWLNSVLKKLGWTVEGLQKDKLTRCSRNEHHYVLDGRVKKHYKKCGQEEGQEDAIDTAATIHITPSLQAAVLAHAKMEQDNISLQQQQSVTMPTSLVDESLPPNDVFSHGPLHIISYIKSWKMVPKVFAVVNPTFLKVADVKAWLFKNLPRGHAHETVIGGEVFVVESILKCLTQSREGGTVNPDHVVMSTQHLLGGNTASFILELWRFLSISSLQEQHSIPNSVVNELAPLPLLTKPQSSQRFPSHMLQAAQQASTQEEECSQGVAPHITSLSVDDRRTLYDFVVEAAGRRDDNEKMDDLYRDDFNPKSQKGLNKHEDDSDISAVEMMAKQRDYKRRRQTYRAKNVHITKRSTVEVMRDVINARMAELAAQLQEEDDVTHCQGSIGSHDPRHSNQNTSHKHHKHHSRSRSRSRSRDVPLDKGPLIEPDSKSHNTKHSDRHKHHKPRSHKRHKSQSRSRSRSHEKKHKHKHEKD